MLLCAQVEIDASVATAWLIMAPDSSTSGVVGFLQSEGHCSGKLCGSYNVCMYTTYYNTLFALH
jgi:hypothetical protein